MITVIYLSFSVTCFAYDSTQPDSADILFIVDVSGSMNRTDSDYYVRDALRLGVDLAPENSRVAIMAVNFEVVSKTDLTDVSTSEGRRYLKDYIDRLENQGDTSFAAGFEQALEIMKSSYAYQKRIVFLGDFIEGGYNIGSRTQEAATAELIDDIAGRAKGNGIDIDIILWGDMQRDSITASHFLALPQATGGKLMEISNPNRASACVEEIYFDNFEYQYSILSLSGESGQALQMPMPTDNVRRAHIYVSAQSPVSSFGASYAGANLDGEQNRSYSIIELTRPLINGVSITLNPGEAGSAYIYTLLEYDPMTLSVSVESDLAFSSDNEDEDEASVSQVSTIYTEIVDAETGKPLLVAPYPDNAIYTVEINSPRGKIPISYDTERPTAYSVFPEFEDDFGTYQIMAKLEVGGIVFGPFTATIDVPDIRPIPEPVPPPVWPMIVAVALCFTFILSSLIIAFRIRKREVEYRGAVEMASNYRFHGKLSVYAVMLEGGARELRPFDFGLHKVQEKRITLRNILDSVGATDVYTGAEDILFLVGPEESVVIRNFFDREIFLDK